MVKRRGKYSKKSLSPFKKQSPFKSWLHDTFPWFFRMNIWQRIALILGIIALVLVVTAALTYLYYFNDISDKNRLMNANNTGIVLLDKNGETFYSRGQAEKRDMVPLGEVSDSLKKALIASEDKNFYDHQGFSPLSAVRALITGVGGGSTITQQLAKNTLLTSERSIFRKYQELTISVAIEQRYTKDEILEMYLNSVYYGEASFGIRDAAETYFNKQPKDLDLAESAMLIGLLPAPSAYSPVSGDAKLAKERQTTVLTRMVRNGFISESEKTEALNQELSYAPKKSKESLAPHFAEMVLSELYDRYGEERVTRSGYRVTTTLDLGLQREMVAQIQKQGPNIARYKGSNAGGVAIDTKTGEVRALVGSIDYDNEQFGKVNMAITPRQPASSFKPIYYAAALANGTISPATVIKDEPINIGGYKPTNFSGRNYGDVSVRYSLANSLNIPSVKIAQKMGVPAVINAAQRLGIKDVKDSDESHGLSIALGSVEAKLIDMTNAYAAFANKGVNYDRKIVHSVKDKFDKTIYTASSNSHRAISEQGAYLVTNILSDNSARAPSFGSSLTVSGKDVAVKTGTSNDARDAWTIGYSPSIAVGVWVGNNDNSLMLSGGTGLAGPIWRGVMTYATKNSNDKFTQPTGLVRLNVCKSDGKKALSDGDGVVNEIFLQSAQPTETCDPNPKMIEVCNLDTLKIETIKEKDFDEDDGKYSKDLTKCETKKISVCEIETGKIVSIDEDDFDSDKYSRSTRNCKKPSDRVISVCELDTNEVISINESEFDEDLHSKDLTKCQTTDNPVSP